MSIAEGVGSPSKIGGTMLTNEELIKQCTGQLREGYVGIAYSVINTKSISHYPNQACYGSMPVHLSRHAIGVIIWVQKDYSGVKEFCDLVVSEDFLYKDLKIKVIEVDDKIGFVYWHDNESPLAHAHVIMSFFKMCRLFTEHRVGGAGFKILVDNGMKPMLAAYLAQYYRATGNRLQYATLGGYHGAWADNNFRIMWVIYYNRLGDVDLKDHSYLRNGLNPFGYAGCDGFLGSLRLRTEGMKTTTQLVTPSFGLFNPKLENIRGSFSDVHNVVVDIPDLVKMYHDKLDELAPVGPVTPKAPNPEDEDF